MSLDLSSLTLKDLRDLQEQVKVEIHKRQEQDVASARAQIEEIARSVGMTVDQLLSTKAKKGGAGNGTVLPAKYQHPDDKSKTWTGRGRQPGWVKEVLAGGKSLADIAVK